VQHAQVILARGVLGGQAALIDRRKEDGRRRDEHRCRHGQIGKVPAAGGGRRPHRGGFHMGGHDAACLACQAVRRLEAGLIGRQRLEAAANRLQLATQFLVVFQLLLDAVRFVVVEGPDQVAEQMLTHGTINLRTFECDSRLRST
jgi:hypothetical protein